MIAKNDRIVCFFTTLKNGDFLGVEKVAKYGTDWEIKSIEKLENKLQQKRHISSRILAKSKSLCLYPENEVRIERRHLWMTFILLWFSFPVFDKRENVSTICRRRWKFNDICSTRIASVKKKKWNIMGLEWWYKWNQDKENFFHYPFQITKILLISCYH